MINELGDQHSYFQSPAAIEEEARAVAGQLDFVGIGALLQNTTEGGAQVILVFPDGPATEAGLLPHVMLPTFLDETIDDQVREALKAMTADGSLDGLILDMRTNGGGLGSVAQANLGMFLGGPQGAYVTRESREEFVVEVEDIGGSQAVPLVVLIGPDTVSYGEIVSGILQHAGRAMVVGQATLGNVEQLKRYDLEDGSRAWIASATFEPIGLPAGIWEDTGIIPEVLVSGTWDEFSEANDPGLAAAVEILLAR